MFPLVIRIFLLYLQRIYGLLRNGHNNYYNMVQREINMDMSCLLEDHNHIRRRGRPQKHSEIDWEISNLSLLPNLPFI